MQYRRIRTHESAVAPTILIGLGLGLAAGFLLGELYANEGPRRIGGLLNGRHRKPEEPTAEALTFQIHQALVPVLGDQARTLQLTAVGRSTVELHGWVPTRRARVKSIAAAREVIGRDRQLVDRLLVEGEDDLPAPSIKFGEEP
jgi:hypothetical protein